MAQSKPTEKTIERVLAAVFEEARANNALPEVVAAVMKELRETDPKAAHAALRAMIDAMAAVLPAYKRRKFLEELLAYMQPN